MAQRGHHGGSGETNEGRQAWRAVSLGGWLQSASVRPARDGHATTPRETEQKVLTPLKPTSRCRLPGPTRPVKGEEHHA